VHELLIKAAPLILIAVGLALCFQSRNWNIGAEGQFIMGAILGSALPVLAPDFTPWFLLPLMCLLGAVGALAGIAGLAEVSGAGQQLRPVISPGYGFTAIIVAFLGRLNPLGIVAAGLVLALTYLGGEAAQMSLGLSDKVVRVFQGMLLFFVLATDTLIHYQVRFSAGGAQRGNR